MMRVNDAYVRVRARINMKMNLLVDMYTDSFKFYEDLFIGCRELLKQNWLCIFIIFKCIFRYYLIIHVFLAHQWCEYLYFLITIIYEEKKDTCIIR